MNIIILFESDKQPDGSYCIRDYRAEHIRAILKSKVNDRLEIGLLNDRLGSAVVKFIDSEKVVLDDIELQEAEIDNQIIDIIVALPRPQTVKKVLFTTAMMGVRNLFFIRSNRVEKSFFHSPLLEQENLQQHLIEGLQQGKRTKLPIVSIHEQFKPFMQDWICQFYDKRKEQPLKLLPELDCSDSLAQIYDKQNKHLLVAIGPEGGWVDFEIELMQSLGFAKFSLGSWTLRVEHALTACLAQLEVVRQR